MQVLACSRSCLVTHTPSATNAKPCYVTFLRSSSTQTATAPVIGYRAKSNGASSLAVAIVAFTAGWVFRDIFIKDEQLELPSLVPPPRFPCPPSTWPQLLDSRSSRELVAHSIATEKNSGYFLLVRNMIRSGAFTAEQVVDFCSLLIDELLKPSACPENLESIATWLFILKDRNDQKNQDLLLKLLSDKGTLEKFLKHEKLWYTADRYHAPTELKADLSRLGIPH